MKKVLFGLALSAVFAAQAEDTYLYWMMDNSGASIAYENIQVSAMGAGTDWKAVPLELAIEGENGYLTISDNYVTKDEAKSLSDAGYGFYVNLGQYASDAYTYYFELVADGGEVVGHSGTGLTWANAQQYIAKSAMQGGGTAGGGSWTPTTSGGFIEGPTPIPEPTSGIMMLLGVAVLGLRRRRRA